MGYKRSAMRFLGVFLLVPALCCGGAQQLPSFERELPIEYPFDLAYDQQRATLYASSQEVGVKRFDVATGASLGSLSPAGYSGFMLGIDLSQDGSTLAMAKAGGSSIVKWDLNSGSYSTINYTPSSPFEGGSLDVFVATNQSGLITGQFNGSGWIPLRGFSPSGVVSTLSLPDDNDLTGVATFLRSPIANEVFILDGGSSGSPVIRYNALTRTVEAFAEAGFVNSRAAIRRDGQLLAFGGSVSGGIGIYNRDLLPVDSIVLPKLTSSAAFHPITNELFVARASPAEIVVYSPDTFDFLYSFPIGATIPDYAPAPFSRGKMLFSDDGKTLWITTEYAIRQFSVPIPEATVTAFGICCLVATRCALRRQSW